MLCAFIVSKYLLTLAIHLMQLVARANSALHGGDADTRKYAALLLVVSAGKDSPPVRRLMASNPSGEVREVVEHGLQWQHSHQHAAE